MLRKLALSSVIAVSLQMGMAQADFAAGQAAYDAGKFRDAYDAWNLEAWNDDARAQEGLAQLLESGTGVVRNVYIAYVWYRIADFHPDVDLTAKLAELATRLTQAGVEWAEQKAYERSIQILAEKNWSRPRLEPAQRSVHRDSLEAGYPWLCECRTEDYPTFDDGIGSEITF